MTRRTLLAGIGAAAGAAMVPAGAAGIRSPYGRMPSGESLARMVRYTVGEKQYPLDRLIVTRRVVGERNGLRSGWLASVDVLVVVALNGGKEMLNETLDFQVHLAKLDVAMDLDAMIRPEWYLARGFIDDDGVRYIARVRDEQRRGLFAPSLLMP